ncbi:MAG: DNA recombination protein RmuC [Candidatus Pacebacteria bacterium]|nr:DNA recombination protein RmuC [Candidatus Paceibacterota bacterium]
MTILWIIIALLAGIIITFLFLRNQNQQPTQDGGLPLLLEQINELRRTMDSRLGDNERSVRESMMHQSRESRTIITDITERLTRLDETNKQVVSFADQLDELQNILKNPKQRGILGEYYLETLLKNILPPGSYKMQHTFADGLIVDCAIYVKDKIIPVDSKFSLENYNRVVEAREPAERDRLEKLFLNDLKNRIKETSKYIKPNESTMDFAFMFIPHEAIYYDLIINKIGANSEEDNNQSLIEIAASKYKVIIVSPTSFLAYLQTVLQGLRALQIEETAKDIIKRVEELGRHLKGYEDYHSKLGNALGTVVNHYNNSSKELKKVDKDVMRITGEAPGLTPEMIERALLDE